MALRELLARFGVEVEGQEKIERFEGVLGGVLKQVRRLGTILTGGIIAEGLNEFIHSTVEAGTEINKMSARLGVSTETLQAWQYAAIQSHATAEDLTTGLRFLSRNIGQASAGGGEGAAHFQKLGIHLKDAKGQALTPTEKLPILADKIHDMKNPADQAAAAMDLLGRGGLAMVPMLAKGSEGIKQLQEEFEKLGGGISDEFLEDAEQAELASNKWKVVTQGLKTMLVGSFLPGLTMIISKIVEYAAAFRKLVSNSYALRTALMAITGVAIIPFLFKMIKAAGLLDAEMLLLNLQWVLIAAAIFAAYLVFDDLYTLFQGGNSVLGKIIDKMFGFGASKKFVEEVTKAWHELTDGAGALLPIIKDIAKDIVIAFVDSIPYIIKFGEIMYNVIGGTIAEIMDELGGLGNALGDLAGGNFKVAWEDIKKGELQRQADDKRMTSGVAQAWNREAPRAHELSGGSMAEAPESDYRNEKWANGKGAVSIGTIKIENNISGVTDPKKAAEHTSKATRKSMDGETLRKAFSAVGTFASVP